MTLDHGTIKRLHVDRRIIAANRKHGRNDPAITVQTSKGSHKCRTAAINGPSVFVQRPQKPLSCGATLWIQTFAQVVLE